MLVAGSVNWYDQGQHSDSNKPADASAARIPMSANGGSGSPRQSPNASCPSPTFAIAAKASITPARC